MIYLIWSVLNLIVLVCFLFICFSVLKPIKENLGLLAVVIFVVGCLSFIKGSVMNDQQGISVDPEIKGQIVEGENVQKEMFFSIELLYVHAKDTLSNEMHGTTVKTGLVIGHEWKPAVSRLSLKDHKIKYFCSGIHDWKLLGLTLYSEPKEFEGVIEMK